MIAARSPLSRVHDSGRGVHISNGSDVGLRPTPSRRSIGRRRKRLGSRWLTPASAARSLQRQVRWQRRCWRLWQASRSLRCGWMSGMVSLSETPDANVGFRENSSRPHVAQSSPFCCRRLQAASRRSASSRSGWRGRAPGWPRRCAGARGRRRRTTARHGTGRRRLRRMPAGSECFLNLKNPPPLKFGQPLYVVWGQGRCRDRNTLNEASRL